MNRNSHIILNQHGQTMVEAGIVMLFFVPLILGVLTFGHGLMVGNVITNAARAGARMASMTPTTARDPNGIIGDMTPIENAVRASIATVDGDGTWANSLVITVTQDAGVNVPVVSVQVTGTVPGLVQFATFSGFAVDRTVTFPDQGR